MRRRYQSADAIESCIALHVHLANVCVCVCVCQCEQYLTQTHTYTACRESFANAFYIYIFLTAPCHVYYIFHINTEISPSYSPLS